SWGIFGLLHMGSLVLQVLKMTGEHLYNLPHTAVVPDLAGGPVDLRALLRNHLVEPVDQDLSDG
ncbi:MAG: hypothetical protein ACO37D_11725, partial [Rhodothermales bacterium]